MESFWDLLDIRRVERVLNAQVEKLCVGRKDFWSFSFNDFITN